MERLELVMELVTAALGVAAGLVGVVSGVVGLVSTVAGLMAPVRYGAGDVSGRRRVRGNEAVREDGGA